MGMVFPSIPVFRFQQPRGGGSSWDYLFGIASTSFHLFRLLSNTNFITYFARVPLILPKMRNVYPKWIISGETVLKQLKYFLEWHLEEEGFIFGGELLG